MSLSLIALVILIGLWIDGALYEHHLWSEHYVARIVLYYSHLTDQGADAFAQGLLWLGVPQFAAGSCGAFCFWALFIGCALGFLYGMQLLLERNGRAARIALQLIVLAVVVAMVSVALIDWPQQPLSFNGKTALAVASLLVIAGISAAFEKTPRRMAFAR